VKNRRGDARSDLYAVGVILYEMLTGETLFHGANPFAVMNARLVASPRPPREINPEISPGLQAIVLRALERNPNHRYASAQEFAQDLSHPDEIAFHALQQPPPARRRSLATMLMRAILPALLVGFHIVAHALLRAAFTHV
jgi:serine/threonine-protein kinase